MGIDSFTDGVIPQHRTVVELIDDRVDSDGWTDSPSPCDCVRRLAEVVLTDDETKPVRQRFLDARGPVADAMGYDNRDSIYQPIERLFDDESVYYQKYTPRFIDVLKEIEADEDLEAVYEEVEESDPLA